MATIPPHPPSSKNQLASQTPNSKSSSQSINAGPRSQARLLEIIPEELHDAVFESPSLLHTVCPLNDKGVDKAIDDLAVGYFPSPLSQASQQPLTPLSRLDKSNERQNYPELECIFNDIVRIGKPYGNKFHSNLKFCSYDKPTTDQADGKGRLKPDLVGIHAKRKSCAARYAWPDIQIGVEVKDTWDLAMRQAGTYGRSMLEQDKRWFSLVIVYNNAEQTLRFCFFTRVGLFTTPKMLLTDLKGFKEIARGLIGIMALGRHEAGIDEHHLVRAEVSYINLPASNSPGRWWRVTNTLCRRICIRGRATHVYCVDPVPEEGVKGGAAAVTQGLREPKISPSTTSTVLGFRPAFGPSDSPGPVTRSMTRSQPPQSPSKSMPSEIPKSFKLSETPHSPLQPSADPTLAPQPSNPPNNNNLSKLDAAILKEKPLLRLGTISTLSSHLIIPVVVKESWPLRDRAHLEPEMFLAVKGRHGIPDVHGNVSDLEILSCFTQLKDFRKCIDFKVVYSDPASACPLPELRGLVRMACGTQGTSLSSIADQPAKVVKALIDSMIGHMELFLAGYLHRDVTIGNVLTRAEAQERRAEMMENNKSCLKGDKFAFLEPWLGSCSGFIIDGDLAIKWKEARIPAKHRSGTLPFISFRVLHAWANERQVLHTAIDDLESFIWVLVWAVLQKTQSKTVMERGWFWGLSGDDIQTVAGQKSTIILTLSHPALLRPSDFSEPLQNVLPLLLNWFKIALDGQATMSHILEAGASGQNIDDIGISDDTRSELERSCVEYYIKYLKAGVEFLSTCKRSA